ncbi:glycoside hydrolase family 13 protein [Infundibulicybe gibba]|nr:glycoside hydrolase family 13 protein [Infundibulicybe gibba]
MAPRRVAPKYTLFRSLLSTALVSAAICTAALATPVHRALPTNKEVIVQMFDWSWDSVAAECKAFIGPAGYGYVQVSPAQEHIRGPQWWTAYQAVSYIIESRRGNRQQYVQMVKTCHEAGVKVIADIILNHMTGIDGEPGVAGSSFSHYSYPGLYGYNDFHHCGSPDEDIHDFNNRTEAQTCELVNLADLNTGSEYVCDKLAKHGNDLVALGVDGFRIDAAKHIAASELQNIVSRFIGKPYLTQEVVASNNKDTIQPSEYTGIGDVQEFRYTAAIQSAFSSTGIASLQNLDNNGWVSGSSANVFVANHDTERNGGSLRYDSPSNTYTLAQIFSLAHPYGKPTILSSFSISNGDAAGPGGGDCSLVQDQAQSGWLCQHRWTAIAGMVGFHNEVGGAGMNNWVSPGPQQIAFGRGSAGFVAINNQDTSWTATFKTALPAGRYCDAVGGSIVKAPCSGTTFTVASDGVFTATVPSRGAIALHTGARDGSGGGLTQWLSHLVIGG